MVEDEGVLTDEHGLGEAVGAVGREGEVEEACC